MGYFEDIFNSLFGNTDKQAQDAYTNAGSLLDNPYLVNYATQGNSEYSNISEDPRLRQAQLDALSYLQNVGTSGGLTAEDKAQMAQINQETAQQEKAQRDAIMQNMASRGMSGSGAELAQQLAAQQGGANTRSMSGVQTVANAQKRALDAIQNSASLGSQIRGQDYQVSSDKARAQDAINQFNTQTKNSATAQNANTNNQYQMARYGHQTGYSDRLQNKANNERNALWGTVGAAANALGLGDKNKT